MLVFAVFSGAYIIYFIDQNYRIFLEFNKFFIAIIVLLFLVGSQDVNDYKLRVAINVNIIAGLLCGLTFHENNGLTTDFWLDFISYPIRETLASIGYFVAINELLYYFYYNTASNLDKLTPIFMSGLCVVFVEYFLWYIIFYYIDIIPDWMVTIRYLFGSLVTKLAFMAQLVSIAMISFPVAEKPLS